MPFGGVLESIQPWAFLDTIGKNTNLNFTNLPLLMSDIGNPFAPYRLHSTNLENLPQYGSPVRHSLDIRLNSAGLIWLPKNCTRSWLLEPFRVQKLVSYTKTVQAQTQLFSSVQFSSVQTGVGFNRLQTC